MTDRIREFLKTRREDGPCVVVDLDVVRANYAAFARAMPDTRVFYAVKANPDAAILKALAELGSCFDTASVVEIEMAMAAVPARSASPSATPSRRSATSSAPTRWGIRLFAVDCYEEVEKIARVAPRAKVFCRILCDGAGAEWPLSRKFGCVPEMAADVLEHAHRLGLEAYGVSFHVGSQQKNVHAGIRPSPLPPASSVSAPSAASRCPWSISAAASPPLPAGRAGRAGLWRSDLRIAAPSLRQFHPGNHHGAGRGMVANAGLIETEVVLISKKAESDTMRWVFLDIGKFGGLAETMDEPSATRCAPRATATIRLPASSPARPAIRRTCCTRRPG